MAVDSSEQMLPMGLSQLQILEEPHSSLIYLFDEIWTLILKKLTQKEALNLRSVNKDFKTKVDNLYEDWNIRLDENCPYMNMILDLRLKQVIVKRLEKPIPNRRPGILKFPGLLEKIDVKYHPEFCAEDLHILLSQCKNLKSITILSYCSVVEVEFWKTLDPLVCYNFSELHTLNIKLCSSKPYEECLYEFLLSRCRMPKLNSLNVDFYKASFQRLASTLFSFMGRHGQTLKHFSYNCEADRYFTQLSNIDESALQNCSTLETLTISSKKRTDYLIDTWRHLIENQSKLITLEISTFVPMSIRMWTRVCENNFRTLTKFSFDGEVVSETLQYDLSIFSNCVNLNYLKLSLKRRSAGEFVRNFASLPDQIETVIVNSFLISPEEFSNFLKTHHSLLNLEIDRVANETSEFGVNSSVLKDILKHDSLMSVTFQGGCLAKPNIRSERKKFKNILSDLGCTKGWREFGLRTNPDSNTWKAYQYQRTCRKLLL